MNGIKVEIVKLEPLRVASFYGFGPNPEEIAWGKLEEWAKPLGYLDDRDNHPIYGFNNPNPSDGSPNYGYEFWIEIGTEGKPSGDMQIKDFQGGLYAVTRCPVPKDDFEVIGATWHQLATWLEDSSYNFGEHQWLEKHLTADAPELVFILDLMIPIAS
jgi:DNA gyrase inhibitor GyrI